jgi:hypothetical protein
VFIGTPHNGSTTIDDESADASVRNLVKSLLGPESSSEENLRKQCTDIAEISDAFTNCGHSLELVSYHEDDEVYAILSLSVSLIP